MLTHTTKAIIVLVVIALVALLLFVAVLSPIGLDVKKLWAKANQ